MSTILAMFVMSAMFMMSTNPNLDQAQPQTFIERILQNIEDFPDTNIADADIVDRY